MWKRSLEVVITIFLASSQQCIAEGMPKAGGASASTSHGPSLAPLEPRTLLGVPAAPRGFTTGAKPEGLLSSWWKAWLGGGTHKKEETSSAKEFSCHRDCHKHGNCNLDDQRCECRFGYGGEDCAQSLVPACIAVETGEVIDVVGRLPKACECYKQLAQLFAVTINGDTVSTLAVEFSDGAWRTCFQRKGVPPEQQNSTWPAYGEKHSWHRIVFGPDPRHPALTDVSEHEAMAFADRQFRQWNTVPPDTTVVDGNRAHRHCRYRPVSNERKQLECDCTYGYGGENCDEIVPDNCPNNCSNNGACEAMFCHCTKGYFGFDCSRTKSFREPDLAASHTAATQFKIFMYELPSHMAYDDRRHNPNYIAYLAFRDQLARDWSIRTENPWEASLFFIPDAAFWASSNTGEAWAHQHQIFQHLNATYPFWQRNAGRDHFHFVARDRGACDLTLPRDAFLMPPMKLVHFGFHAHMDLTLLWRDPGFNGTYDFARAHSEACFRPMKDLVVPGFIWELDQWAKDFEERAEDTRNVLLFFRGGVRHNEPEYSGGVRQQLDRLLNKSAWPDISFNRAQDAVKPYQYMFLTSLFCLAPWGHGWGLRLNLAMVSGCIPVIIQDHIVQPFEYQLPYHDFSIRLSPKDIPHIISILRGISRAAIHRLQAGVRRHHRAFIWQPGGAAYNYTINSLKQHWTLVKAGVDKRRRVLLAS